MIYSNLIYLLIVLVLLSIGSVPEAPRIPLAAGLLLFLLKGAVYWGLAHRFLHHRRTLSASGYFRAEQRFAILAILFFAIDLYLLDALYFLAKLPLTGNLPVLISLGGLVLFFFYFSLFWTEARYSYQTVFGRSYPAGKFLISNIKTNLPLILPWLALSLLSDLLLLAPFPPLRRFLSSAWGEPAIFLLFFLFLAIGFPVLIVRLWNCRPLPAGPFRAHIEEICRRERLRYAEIMLWPLFEGRMLTAGIMGVSGRFRYLLITPALLEALAPDEMEAVIAHEIGHVKKHHLVLYLLLFLGFALLAQLASFPLLSAVFNSELFFQILKRSLIQPATVLSATSGITMLLLLILYFRFLFGFFMRNFERQADIQAFEAMGHRSGPLIRVLEKIAWLSGNIRDLPSWHHFGIGQRVAFLEKCQRNPALANRHHRKVYGALLLYIATVAGSGYLALHMPSDLFTQASRERLVELLIRQKIQKEPERGFWYQQLGDLQQARKHYDQAIQAYEKALSLTPEDADLLNNLAWLLLTAEDQQVRNPQRALTLAQKAAARKPTGYILDTLATAYWQVGDTPRALQIEQKAMALDPKNRAYYANRLKEFSANEPPGRDEPSAEELTR